MMGMIRFVAAVIFFTGLVLNARPVFSQDAEAVLKRVIDKLNTVNDYEATGNLKTDIPFIKLPASSVTVYYKRPDKYKIKKKEGISVVPKGGISFNINSLFSA